MPTESEISELSNFRGPSFQMVEEVPFEVFERDGGFTDRTTPILLKGAVRHWPAWENWTFDKLATQCDLNEKAIKAIFETALSEQGKTQEKGFLEVSPYLRSLDLAAQEGGNPDKGLLSLNRRATLDAKSRFHLDWARINFVPNKVYLAQWNMLTHLPQLRNDFPMQRIWPGLRKTWEYAFIGPADTLTGLHYDFPNNWFCQVRGVKEVLLFTPDQTPHIAIGKKYDWGAKLSDVDISRLYKKNDIRDRFEQAQGIYARVEAGDALFIPKKTWHAVVSLEPSISLGIFGLTPWEIITGGGAEAVKNLLHNAHLYRWNNCVCHAAAKTTKAA